MQLSELQQKLSENQDSYKTSEVGSGVHSFINDCFKSKHLFNLKETAQKTNKFNTYTHDTESNKNGRPDFVLYINDNASIPVEVKRADEIAKGEKQLFRYQLDYSKHYGILTDGKEWRFYRSTKYTKFLIDDIFENPKDFLLFWADYIKPEKYYIEIFNPSGRQELFDDKIDLNKSENRPIFFDDVTKLISNFKVKMSAIGAWDELDFGKRNEKVAVETSYAYLIQFILYKVLVDNAYIKFKEAYQSTLVKIKKSIIDKDYYSIIINEIKNISEYISKNIYTPFKKEQESINKKLIENLKKNLTIEDISAWLDIIIFIDKYDFSNLKNEIFGFIYENYLKDLYGDKNRGQYFTDPAIVNFMLEELGYTSDAIKNKSDKEISIIDPSCGAGTFLYSAVDKITDAFNDNTQEKSKYIKQLIDKNIFGLDIEEFPLYLAEMNILMRSLPIIVNDGYENPIDNKIKIFKTKDSISEFLDTGISSKQKEADLFSHLKEVALDYPSFMRDEKDLQEMMKSLQENMGTRERFDFVIGNPPYIGYNECCSQGIEFTKKIKNQNDSLLLMSSVYGVNLNTVKGRVKKYPPKPNIYAFFIALGLGLLKDNGKICYIIPQTILTAGDLDVLRYHLARWTSIEKIITFDGKLFVGRGLKQNKPIATSSLVFVASKKTAKENHKVKITNYRPYAEKQAGDFANYLNSKNRDTKEILQSELLAKLENWSFIKQSKSFLKIHHDYPLNSHSIEEYRTLDLPDYDEFHFDVGYILDKNNYTTDKRNAYPILDFKQSYGYTKLCFTQYYPKDLDKIQLTRNSRYNTLNRKYNIVCRVKNFQKFYLIQEPVIFNMGAASIIASDNKLESLFLFSLLNSTINIFMLNTNLKSVNEKEFLVSIKSIKQYIRIPKITKDNQYIKGEIIKQTENMLALEKVLLKDIVDFSSISIQKFDNISVGAGFKPALVLTHNTKEYKLKIQSGKENLVMDIINSIYFAKGLVLEKEILLQELKTLPALDKQKQNKIKDYIDDLVFALYFNIELKETNINKSAHIKSQCQKNEFYEYISSSIAN